MFYITSQSVHTYNLSKKLSTLLRRHSVLSIWGKDKKLETIQEFSRGGEISRIL